MAYDNPKSNLPMNFNPFIREPFEVEKKSKRDFFCVIFRQWRKIAFSFFIVMVIAVMIVYHIPAVYQSVAKIQVGIGRQMLSSDPLIRTEETRASMSYNDYISSEVEILKSQKVAGTVVDNLGIDTFYTSDEDSGKTEKKESFLGSLFNKIKSLKPHFSSSQPVSPRESAIAKVMNSLMVKEENSIITAGYLSSDPHYAHEVLQHIVDVYVQRHLVVFRTDESSQFFEEKTSGLLSEMREAKIVLAKFLEMHNIIDLIEQKRLLFARVNELNTKFEEANMKSFISSAKVSALGSALEQVHKDIKTANEATGSKELAEQLKAKLFELKMQKMELSVKFTEDSREIKSMQRQIDMVSASLKEEYEKIARAEASEEKSNFSTLKLELHNEHTSIAALAAEKTALSEELSRKERQLSKLAALEGEYETLHRDATLREQKYLEYHDNLQKFRIATTLDRANISNLKILQPATLSTVPIKPQRTRIFLMALFAAFFGSLGFGFVSEYFDHAIKTAEDVEKKLGLPVLVSFPLLTKKRIALISEPIPSLVERDTDNE